MFNGIKNLLTVIKQISQSIDRYKKDTVIQSLPSLAYVNRAKKLIEKNNYSEAEVILKDALLLPQKDALVYKYLGIVYERTGLFDLAVENYQISADLDPQDKNIWQRLGFSLISTGKYEQAEKSFENANKVQSGNSDTFTGWGMAFMKMKDYSQAREKFEIASKLNKYNFSALFLCSVMEIKLNMLDKAESKLSFLSNVAPNESNTFEYARLKAMKDDIDGAIHYAQKSLSYNSKMLPSYILLGQLYTQNGDEENALKYFSLAEENGLKTQNLYLEWGKSLIKFEKYTDAKEKFLKSLEYDSDNNDETNINLALCLVLLNDFQGAELLINKISDTENEILKQVHGIIAYENGDIDKAIQLLRNNDENSLNCLYLAKCYEKKDDDTKTREYYEAALQINEKCTEATVSYVNYLTEKQDFVEAQRKLRKSLKYKENDTKLLNLMFYVSYILVKENVYEYNVKEAISFAEKAEKSGKFDYPELKQELIKFLQERE